MATVINDFIQGLIMLFDLVAVVVAVLTKWRLWTNWHA